MSSRRSIPLVYDPCMVKAPGELARLTYDTHKVVEEGDYVRSVATRRLYLVQHAREVNSTAKRHPHRWALTCVVMPDDHPIEDDAAVHPLYWHRR